MAVYPPPREIVPIWNKINFAHSDTGATEDWCLMNFLGLKGGQISGNLVVLQNTILNTLLATTITTSNLYATTISSATINTNLINATNIYNTTITTSNIFATTLTSSNIFATTLTSTFINNTTITSINMFATAITTNNMFATTITSSSIYTGSLTASTNLSIGTSSNTSTGYLYYSDNLNGTKPFRTSNNGALKTEYYSGGIWNLITQVASNLTTFYTGIYVSGVLNATTITASSSLNSILGNITTLNSTTGNITNIQSTTISASTAINSATGNLTNIQASTISASTSLNTVTGNITTLNSTTGNFTNIQATTISASTAINSVTGNITNMLSSAITNSGNISIGTSSNTSSGFIYLSDNLLGTAPIRISNNNSLKTEYFNGTIWNTLMSISSAGSILNSNLSVSGSLIASSLTTGGSLNVGGAGYIAGSLGVSGGVFFGSTLGVTGAVNCSNILCASVSCSTLYASGAVVLASTIGTGALTATSINSSGSCSIATTLNIGGAVVCASTIGTGALTATSINSGAISGTNLSISGTITFAGQLITTTQAIMTRIGIGNSPSTFAFTESYASELQIGSLNSGNDYGFSMAMSNVYARYRETAVVNQLKIGTNMSTLGVQDNISYPSWSIYMGNDDLHINQARPNGSETTVFSINASSCTFVNSVYFAGGLNMGGSSILNYYEEATISIIVQTSFNFSTIYSGNAYFVRVGKLVTMRIPVIRADLLGGFIYCPYLNGVPARFRPTGTTSVSFSIPVVNLGAYQTYSGQLIVWYTGQFIIYMTASGSGNFSSGANSGSGTDVVVSWTVY